MIKITSVFFDTFSICSSVFTSPSSQPTGTLPSVHNHHQQSAIINPMRLEDLETQIQPQSTSLASVTQATDFDSITSLTHSHSSSYPSEIHV